MKQTCKFETKDNFDLSTVLIYLMKNSINMSIIKQNDIILSFVKYNYIDEHIVHGYFAGYQCKLSLSDCLPIPKL